MSLNKRQTAVDGEGSKAMWYGGLVCIRPKRLTLMVTWDSVPAGSEFSRLSLLFLVLSPGLGTLNLNGMRSAL